MFILKVVEYLISDPSNHERCITGSSLVQNLICETKDITISISIGLKLIHQFMSGIDLTQSPINNDVVCHLVGNMCACIVLSKQMIVGAASPLEANLIENENWCMMMSCVFGALRTSLQFGDESGGRSLLMLLASLGNDRNKQDFSTLVLPTAEE